MDPHHDDPAACSAVVLDDTEGGRRLARLLAGEGLGDVRLARGCTDLDERLASTRSRYVIADPVAAGVDPAELAARIAEHDVPMVLVGSAPPADSLALTRLDKPVSDQRLVTAARQARIAAIARGRPPESPDEDAFAGIVGEDPALREAMAVATAVAGTGETVLITGETGTGKDLIAQAIHRLSGRRGAYVALNVAGFDDALFSDALFGHRRGAFTGASETRLGMILRASSGTLFLDEVGDLAIPSQVKLLRLLENASYLPLGDDVEKHSTARVLAATSVPLAELMGVRMRADLFYRLRVHHLHLPPLRERFDDLPLLCDHLLRHARRGQPPLRIPIGLYDLLRAHRFAGNVRELRSVLIHAAACSRDDVLDLAVVRRALSCGLPAEPVATTFPALLPTLDQVQAQLIEEALRRADGNQATAARLIGVTRQALNKRLVRRR